MLLLPSRYVRAFVIHRLHRFHGYEARGRPPAAGLQTGERVVFEIRVIRVIRG